MFAELKKKPFLLSLTLVCVPLSALQCLMAIVTQVPPWARVSGQTSSPMIDSGHVTPIMHHGCSIKEETIVHHESHIQPGRLAYTGQWGKREIQIQLI